MGRYECFLKGRNWRSIGMPHQVIAQIKNQKGFDELLTELFNPDRRVVMGATDPIEKFPKPIPLICTTIHP